MKRIFSMIMCALLLAAALSGCGGQGAETTAPGTDSTATTEAPTTQGQSGGYDVKFIVPDGAPVTAVVKLIEERPEISDGANVTYEVVTATDLLASKLLSGEADAAIIPTNLAATLYNKEAGGKLAGVAVWGLLYVVSTQDIDSIDDLRGLEVYNIGQGLTPDITMRYIMQQNGMNPESDVTLKYMTGQEAAQSLIAGKISTAVLGEPAATQVISNNPDAKIVLDLQEEWKAVTGMNESYPQACLYVGKRLLDEHPDFVDSLILQVERSAEWFNENAAKAGEYSEKHSDTLKAAVVEKAAPRFNVSFMSAQQARPAIEQYLEVLYHFSSDAIGGKMPNEEFYYKP